MIDSIDSFIIDNEKNEISKSKDDGPKEILRDELIIKISNYLKKK